MELLAPAGGPEQLRMAVHFGANAVYLAGRRWGMRARAENFSDEELRTAIAYAHEHGVAVHVALNVVLTDEDFDELPAYLRLVDEAGADALIVADLGLLDLARIHAPHVALHLSTQANVMNAASADAYARLGVSRIVLARELSVAQIAQLRRRATSELELEAFAHGSMCMAYSGRCLISAELMGKERSASRGACVQPCRWGWTLVEDRTSGLSVDMEVDEYGSYLLSSNDLCMIEHLDALAEAGVDAIKLEGRNKGAYYVACVTNAYRHVLDGESAQEWVGELDAVSHRPYSTGFYFGDPTQNPGRVDYARERNIVAVVEGCEPRTDGRFDLVLRCRNKVLAGAVVQVLAPGVSVRELRVADPKFFDEQADAWVSVTELSRAMGLYSCVSNEPLTPLDVLCCATSLAGAKGD